MSTGINKSECVAAFQRCGCADCNAIRRSCPCGSGKPWEDEVYDARGIYIAKVCEDCREEKLAGYRPEVLSDPGYEADEPIESDDDFWYPGEDED